MHPVGRLPVVTGREARSRVLDYADFGGGRHVKQKGLGRIAVLGAGKIGESLIGGLIDSGLVARDQLVATAKHPERLEALQARLRIETTLDNAEAVRGASVVILAVKPQAMEEGRRAVRGRVARRQLGLFGGASAATVVIGERLRAGVA